MEAPNQERLAGVVERITFHSAETGWSVLKVAPFDQPGSLVPVLVHQVKVYAGATIEFRGSWSTHPRFGEQFRAESCVERKPATAAALEKYLGGGLIRGVGPATARKIVNHFGKDTLEVFENNIDALMAVRGIAAKKLETIRDAWQEHRAVRTVIMFLQEHGISTLFAVRIYKAYGNGAIETVRENPYRLARDIYGIGFFSADRIAMSLGFARDGEPRIRAGVKHVLAASREVGHCFLTRPQVVEDSRSLLATEPSDDLPDAPIEAALDSLLQQGEVCRRILPADALGVPLGGEPGSLARCYYAKSLYFAEQRVAQWVAERAARSVAAEGQRVRAWLDRFCAQQTLKLSDEQGAAVAGIVRRALSILTGGPGCGKTTATRVLVRLLRAMGQDVLLAAPTGRAAQRMTEVVGLPARTIHRLLEWEPKRGGFKRSAESPLVADFVIIDEASMLDVSLAASLFDAIAPQTSVLLIGDPNQLPPVGAGNVLRDLLRCDHVHRAVLTQVFRQAEASDIVRHAHAIDDGQVPSIPSPLGDTGVWQRGRDCLFVDAEEATQAQLRFIRRARAVIDRTLADGTTHQLATHEGRSLGRLTRGESGLQVLGAQPANGVANQREVDAASQQSSVAQGDPGFVVPRKFLHVDLEELAASRDHIEELAAVLRRIPRDSALNYGMSAVDVVRRLATKTIPERLGSDIEVQVLSPMNRGSVGAPALNKALQQANNPEAEGKGQLLLGERILRVGDRVIQRRNNYDKGVFNGDIGRIVEVNAEAVTCVVLFDGSGTQNSVLYQRDDLFELALAYAITIHKSQGSEFDAVIVPLLMQHHRMLFRNLVYTALTRAKKLAVFVGSRQALARAVSNVDTFHRQTALTILVEQTAGLPGSTGSVNGLFGDQLLPT